MRLERIRSLRLCDMASRIVVRRQAAAATAAEFVNPATLPDGTRTAAINFSRGQFRKKL